MSNTDAEIATIARKLFKTIDEHTQMMQQLAAIGKRIEDHLDNLELDELTGLLGLFAGGAETAAIASETSTNEICFLSGTLRSLLNDKKEAENGSILPRTIKKSKSRRQIHGRNGDLPTARTANVRPARRIRSSRRKPRR